MKERATNWQRWRIGELAEATGLTVRTLHHYEHIGLLAPDSRTQGRQRLYDHHDVRRLYRIRALRDLGLSLADIGHLLNDKRAAFADVLRAHRARVDAEIQQLERLRVLLDHACAQAENDVEPQAMLLTIEAMSHVTRHSDARRKKGNASKDTEAQWRTLGDELRACMKAGDAPSSPRARAVARKALARIVEFAEGDPATLEALAHLRRISPQKDLAGWSPAMMRYFDQAIASLESTEPETC